MLVDAVVNRQELAIPPKITLEMAKGFTLYMVKAVMSGRGDEVLDQFTVYSFECTFSALALRPMAGQRTLDPSMVVRVHQGQLDLRFVV